MAQIFNLPAVGDTMVEGEIIEWFVSVGDVVDLDQAICSLETDKSVVEMTTPHRGTVLALGSEVGGTVEVGTPLIIVGEPGEAVPVIDAAPKTAAPVAAAVTQPRQSVTASGPVGQTVRSPVLRQLAADYGVNLAMLQGTGVWGRITREDIMVAANAQPTPIAGGLAVAPGPVLAMPRIRKLARERSVDLADLSGTGPRGAITESDLPPAPRGRREPMSALRRTIAQRLTQSVQEIPQFTSMVDFDATALLATRAELKAQSTDPMPIDALFMHRTAEVLADHPLMNAQLVDDHIEFFDDTNLGVAVDTPHGLMLPVVRSANTLTVAELATEISRLATQARERTISAEDLTDATCTINNVGALGILMGTPILPLNTSTIVAFGAARPSDSSPRIMISATFDHRLIDGGDSARFLKDLARRLELG